MGDFLTLGEAAPQIAIALAICGAGVAVALIILRRIRAAKPAHPQRADPADLVRQVRGLVEALTDHNGDPLSGAQCAAVAERDDERFGKIDSTLASHSKMHRKQFAAIASLRKGQNEILDHITNGNGSKRPEPNYDIDAEDTGRFEAGL